MVIVGAGFAGLAACEAVESSPVDVCVVERHNFNTFQPLLYQMATAGLNPGDIAHPALAAAAVVAGGGPTGVELAGTLAERRRMELETLYRDLDPDAASVVLVERRERLLLGFDERLLAYARSVLEARGVRVRLGETVAEVTPMSVRLASGEVVHASAVVWAAGVGEGELTSAVERPKTHGRLDVGPDLRLVGEDRVFAAGDMAAATAATAAAPATAAANGRGVTLPQLAQPAIQEGRHVGRQIAAMLSGLPTSSFVYKDKGIMATIGRRAAVAELPRGIRLRGTLAWIAWLGLHLVLLLGVRNRAAVLLNWAWRYVSWRRVPKVIAGA